MLHINNSRVGDLSLLQFVLSILDSSIDIKTVNVLLTLLQSLGNTFTEHEASKFKKIYKKSIRKAKELFKDKNKDIVNFFEIEWKNFKDTEKILLDTKLSYKLNTIKYNDAASILLTFLYMKRTYEHLFKIKIGSDLFPQNTNDLNTSHFIGGDLISCQKIVNKNVINYYLTKDSNYFLLLDKNNTKNEVKRIKLMSITTLIDDKEPRKMIVINNKSKKEEINLYFKDSTTSFKVKERLDECTEKLLEEKLVKINEYFNLCENLINTNEFQ